MADRIYELCSSNYQTDGSGNVISGMVIDLIRGTIRIGQNFAITSDGIVNSTNGNFTGISLSGLAEGTDINLGHNSNHPSGKNAILTDGDLINGSVTNGYFINCKVKTSSSLYFSSNTTDLGSKVKDGIFSYCSFDDSCNLYLKNLNTQGVLTNGMSSYSLNTDIGIAQNVYLLTDQNLSTEIVTDVSSNGNVTKQTLSSLLKGNVGTEETPTPQATEA